MRFLNQFLRICRAWFRTRVRLFFWKRPNEHPDAQVARFLFQSNHASGSHPTHKAFMPPADLQLSVYNVDHLGGLEIWKLSDQVRIESTRPNVYGRAQLSISSIIEAGLRAIKAPPPPRHVVVIGWDANKARHKAVAQKLAAAATYYPYGSGS